MTDQTGPSNNSWQRYRQRVQRVVDYIHANPAGDLSNDTLAEVACLSSFHWHRIYRGITGETTAFTVRRVRLQRAATALLRTDQSIADIGTACGYPQLHSFTRTFKACYGVSPGKFRDMHRSAVLPGVEPLEQSDAWPVRLENRPALILKGLWHHGDFMEIGGTFEKVLVTAAIEGWIPESPQTLGIYPHDPAIVDAASLRSFAGIVCAPDSLPDTCLDEYAMAGSRYAVATHQGPYAFLDRAYLWLYADWLRESGETLGDRPCAEQYLNSPRDTPIDALLTEICLPLSDHDV